MPHFIYSDPEGTATSFSADVHVNYFENTFSDLDIEKVSDFAFCQIADSTNLNPSIARKLGIPHVGCRNHCLNLGCEDMEKADTELAELSDKIHEAHKTINGSNVLSATLHNVQQACQAYSSKLRTNCTTRWGAICMMVNSHLKSENEIREVHRQFPTRVSEETVTSDFRARVERHTPYLNNINECSAYLQTRGATLAECQDALDVLADLAEDGMDSFEYCQLKDDKFKAGNKYDSGKSLSCV